MNFAFIGSEPEWQQLRSWFASPSEHSMVAVLPDPAAGPWGDWPHSARRIGDFEELLADSGIGALILAGPVPARAARLRRIAQAGRACLCFQPADLAAIFYQEVALIAEETRAVLVPMMPGRGHPAWQKLLLLCRSGILGDLATARIERMGSSPAGRELLAGIYAEAAGLLETLIGEIAETTATGDPTSGRLVVQHSTAAGLTGEIRLVEQPAESERWTITVEAQRGRAELNWPVGLMGSAQLRWSETSGSHAVDMAAPAQNQSPLAELARALTGQPHTPTWDDAVRAAELAECAAESLWRRRSVDVFRGKADELASFKGRMASCGCALIWMSLLVLIVVAAGKGLGVPGMDWLATAMIAVWVAFLAMQSLRWVLPSAARSKPGEPEHDAAHDGGRMPP